MLPREYDWLAAALRARHEAELLAERKRERRRARLRKWLRLRVIAATVGAFWLILLGGYVLLGWGIHGDPGYSVRVTLRDADGRPLNAPEVSLVRADGTDHGRWRPLFRSKREGVYGSLGLGAVCGPEIDCEAEWEIRARGFKPFAFRMADYCPGWNKQGCFAMELSATLTRDDTKHADDDCEEKCPDGAICDPGYLMHFDLRDPRGRPIGCNFDLVLAGSSPSPPGRRVTDRDPRFGVLKDGSCSTGAFGHMSISTQFEIRADGFQPFRFVVADYCSEPHCGNCLKVGVRGQLDTLP